MTIDQPALLVVDEPASALDANLRVEILSLLRKVALERGASVLLISHDLALVARFSDRVMVNVLGTRYRGGPTSLVLLASRHPYTVALLGSAPTVRSRRRQPLSTCPCRPKSSTSPRSPSERGLRDVAMIVGPMTFMWLACWQTAWWFYGTDAYSNIPIRSTSTAKRCWRPLGKPRLLMTRAHTDDRSAHRPALTAANSFDT